MLPHIDKLHNHFATDAFRLVCDELIRGYKIFYNLTQDEDRDPRQILARPTGVVDRGSGATVHNGLEKIWVAPTVWPMAFSVRSIWPLPIFRSVRSGQYPYFGLFGLANTRISGCSVWLIPVFRYVRSG